jgi:hypothetical protein
MIYNNISYTPKYIENVRALPQAPNIDTPIIHTITQPTKNMHNSIMKMKPEIDYSIDTVTHTNHSITT